MLPVNPGHCVFDMEVMLKPPNVGAGFTVAATTADCPAASRTVIETARSAPSMAFATKVMAAPDTTCVTGRTVASEENT